MSLACERYHGISDLFFRGIERLHVRYQKGDMTVSIFPSVISDKFSCIFMVIAALLIPLRNISSLGLRTTRAEWLSYIHEPWLNTNHIWSYFQVSRYGDHMGWQGRNRKRNVFIFYKYKHLLTIDHVSCCVHEHKSFFITTMSRNLSFPWEDALNMFFSFTVIYQFVKCLLARASGFPFTRFFCNLLFFTCIYQNLVISPMLDNFFYER